MLDSIITGLRNKIMPHFPGAFDLNYSEFPKSCRGHDFALMRARILELLDVGWEGERNVG